VEGLTAGLGAYGRSAAEVSDKEETRQEGIRKEGNQLALAQNQFNQATSTGNRADLAAADAAVKQARTNLATLGMKSIDQQNAVAKDIFEAEAKLKGIAMQEAGANSRYGQEQQTIGMIASKVHAAHPEMAPDEVLKQAYMIKGASSVYGTDVKAGTAEVNKLEDIVKGLQAQLTHTFGSVKINALNQEIARAQANVEAARRGAPITSAAPSSNVIDFSKLPTAK
jgi:hypothetical protein